MHPSSPTLTSLMLQMQQYNKQNESDTVEGPLNRLKRNWSEWVQERGVSQTSKRQKVIVNTFPWVQRERILATPLNMSLTATLALLKLYAQDLKLTRVLILTSPCTPQFPHLEWMSVLTGVMVNLNHVFSGMHAVSNNN